MKCFREGSGKIDAGTMRTLVNIMGLRLEALELYEGLIVSGLMYGREPMLWKKNYSFMI